MVVNLPVAIIVRDAHCRGNEVKTAKTRGSRKVVADGAGLPSSLFISPPKWLVEKWRHRSLYRGEGRAGT